MNVLSNERSSDKEGIGQCVLGVGMCALVGSAQRNIESAQCKALSDSLQRPCRDATAL